MSKSSRVALVDAMCSEVSCLKILPYVLPHAECWIYTNRCAANDNIVPSKGTIVYIAKLESTVFFSIFLFIYLFTNPSIYVFFFRFPINYLLLNLDVADVMFATFRTPQYILKPSFIHPYGVTGTALCALLTGGNLAWTGAASSTFTLFAIATERYYTVMFPLDDKGKLTKRKLKVYRR